MREANMKREMQQIFLQIGLNSFFVTNVRISPDWKYANIYFIESGTEVYDQSMTNLLNSKLHQINNLSKKRCSGHFSPKFRFIFDKFAVDELRVGEILATLDN